MNLIKPPALRHGDAIGVVAPAGPADRERIDQAIQRLRRRGFRIKTYGDIYRRTGHLAGDDAIRSQELMAAFADSETAAVWCARGGYGTSRILEQLDFEMIRRYPKVFIGFSDITAIHLAIQQRVGLVSFHGPNLQDGFGMPDDVSPLTEEALWRAILEDVESSKDVGYQLSQSAGDLTLRSMSPGVATARLTGGNLSVISGLMGTPFEIETAGRILFLEEVDEAPYQIDRYMSQLRLAGKLQTAAGVLLGSFVDDRREVATETVAAIEAVLVEYCGGLGVPVIAGFPAGHQRNNVTLPIGLMVELDADRGSVVVKEHPLA